jgi:hypothetical protein
MASKKQGPLPREVAATRTRIRKKKATDNNRPLVGAPTAAIAAAAAGGGHGPRGDNKHPRQASDSDDGRTRCPVHNFTRHTAGECWEIKKLAEQYREQLKQQQQREDGAPSRQREGKQKVDPEEDKDDELRFQQAKMGLKAVYDHSDSESNDNEHRKTLYIMLGGSWDITYRCIIKTLCQEVTAAVPTPKAAPHHKWMETPIGFDASDCLMNMAGARQLSLLMSPTIANIKLYHVHVDGGATLNLISLATFKRLQISMSKL